MEDDEEFVVGDVHYLEPENPFVDIPSPRRARAGVKPSVMDFRVPGEEAAGDKETSDWWAKQSLDVDLAQRHMRAIGERDEIGGEAPRLLRPSSADVILSEWEGSDPSGLGATFSQELRAAAKTFLERETVTIAREIRGGTGLLSLRLLRFRDGSCVLEAVTWRPGHARSVSGGTTYLEGRWDDPDWLARRLAYDLFLLDEKAELQYQLNHSRLVEQLPPHIREDMRRRLEEL